MLAGGHGYGDYKKELFEMLWTYFEPFRQRRAELQKDPDHVKQILAQGAEKARGTAMQTLDQVRKAVGIAAL